MKKKIYFEGQETNYSVSDDGKVFNDITGKQLKGTTKRNEYHSVQLTINGKLKTLMVHRLVAEAFCEKPNGATTVEHINGDKLDNKAENLRWDASFISGDVSKKAGISAEYLDFMKEELVEVKDNPDYVISKDGKIASKKNLRVLKGSTRNGYKRIMLNGKTYSVHRLVYESFVGPIPEGMVIDHIDGDRANNSLSNLRALTQKQNAKASYSFNRVGKIGVTSFTLNGEKVKHYSSIQDAATEFSVTQPAIKGAANYGTKSCGLYWLRDDSLTTEEEFVSKMPDNVVSISESKNAKISESGLLYSSASKHLIPQFEDENGKYWYIASKGGKYVKFYKNP